MSDLSMESVLGRPWLDESEKTEADQVFIADLSQPNLLSIRQTIHLTSTACTRWNVRKSILTAVYHWILRLYAAILYFWNEHLTLPRSWPSTLLATWTYSTSSHDVQGVSTETLQHLPPWLLRQGELQSCCFGPSTTFDVQVWPQIGIAMSTLNTVGMQSLKRLCISNQWNPKRSQQTQLQGIKCMVPFFQSQTFERRFPCYQDIWGTDFRTSGGANKTVTQICNQSGKALLTAHHVTRRLPKALHMTQATASMGIRQDSETTQMNTQKPKQEWKKNNFISIMLDLWRYYHNAVKISLLRVSRLPSGQWFNHFWKNRREILMRCPICWALPATTASHSGPSHSCPSTAVTQKAQADNRHIALQHGYDVTGLEFSSHLSWRTCVIKTLNMQHCWTNMAALTQIKT